MGSFPYPRNGLIEIDYEFILLFKKLGIFPLRVSEEIKDQSRLTKEEWRQYFTGHWNFVGEKQGKDHIAMFPEELPHRLIKMFSFAGETALDPFLGSGTTTRAAVSLGRNSIGYEINEKYLPIIKEKVGADKKTLCNPSPQFKIMRQKNIPFGECKSARPVLIETTAVMQNRVAHPDAWKIQKEKARVNILARSNLLYDKI